MLGELRLNAAKRAAPFSLPEALEVDQLDAGLASRSPNDVYTIFPHHTARKFMPFSSEAVDVPMLVEPHCSNDLAFAAVSVYLVPAQIDAPSVLTIAVALRADVEVFDALAVLRSVTAISFPAVHDKTDLLGAPRVYGRTDSDDIASDQLSLTPFEAGAAASDCMHGQPRGSCDTCRRERAARQKKLLTKEKGVSIADVLELLWLYLQPPLDPETFMGIFPLPGDKPLMPHQFSGIKFLTARSGALLADEMGLGKTAQAIVAARLLLLTADVTRILVVAPKSVLRQWQDEWDNWAQPEVRVQMVDGQKEQRQQQWEAPAHVWLESYETLRQDWPTGRQLPEYGLVILDEAARVKNPNTKTTRVVRDLPRQRCWALTATPLETKPDDLVNILRLVAVDASAKAHVNKIIAALPRWEHWLAPQEKRKLMQPVMLRRRQKDVLKNLKVVGKELWLELTPEQRSAYQSAFDTTRSEVRGMLSGLDENRARIHILALLQRLKQLCNFDPETRSSAKAEYLVEYLRDEVPDEDKALVFSQYPQESLRTLKKKLDQHGIQMLEIFHGGLSAKKRDALLDSFRADPGYSVLLMSLKAGGVGLNLQEANHVVLFDHWWNPAVHEQAVGRVARTGQRKPVFVRSLFTVDTIEEHIYYKLQEKGKLFKVFVDDLSDDKFRERTEEEITRTDREVEQSLTLEDLLEVLDLPLPEQRARQEKMDAGLRRKDAKLGAPRERSWSGSWDKQRLRELSPSEFEELVAWLYQEMGFQAYKTRDSRDGGVDVVAERQTIGDREKHLIQCKHTKGENVVGVAVVRELRGVLSNTPEATKAVVVTNGAFSKDAQQEVRNSRVELVNGKLLLYRLDQLLSKHQST